ncbi:protein of unknown function (plasmid) [Cupriavidus taiwanensis]|uniref:Uncharacterized protein n=1 Tax=Cupriavidus taiwanensis TaxID=164546 RepID=A0A7Z7NNU4_9BURK|nr:protein of unknown function [Cupriavidus taiwanensis]SOZ11248.1 protein of unknown function [Cupriavidus taiwanensis]SOZ42600.1 protein of unknown function [Cupriavidus taiwanensis]SPC21639.1 protein of unknown function [Cupriavidus taiwanensis]SPD55750.1 protein of unknown function [Cupriavidus taiwanensis]
MHEIVRSAPLAPLVPWQRAASLTEGRRSFGQRGHYICVMARASGVAGDNSIFLNNSSVKAPAYPALGLL